MMMAFLAAVATLPFGSSEPELCKRQFVNGDILEFAFLERKAMPRLEIRNDNGGFAFVRLRGVDNPQLQTIYVAPERSAVIENIPPGEYQILVAYSGKLDSTCQEFVGGGLERFEGTFLFERTEVKTPTDGGTLIQTSATEGVITLYEVEDGNIETEKISLEEFNRP